jgi:hypothetical protein
LGYLGVGERAMLKYKLHKRNRECRCELEWTGLYSLRINSSVWFLWTWRWALGFLKAWNFLTRWMTVNYQGRTRTVMLVCWSINIAVPATVLSTALCPVGTGGSFHVWSAGNMYLTINLHSVPKSKNASPLRLHRIGLRLLQPHWKATEQGNAPDKHILVD